MLRAPRRCSGAGDGKWNEEAPGMRGNAGMNRAIRAAMIALAVAASAPAARAQGPGAAQAASVTGKLAEIQARGSLRVGLTGDYKPFSIVDKQAPGGMQGIDVDMAESLAKSLGVKLELVQTSWPTLMPDLLADRFDLAMGGITITLPRARTAFFSDPVMKGGKTAIARCTDKDKYQTLAEIDRPGVRVIANPGGTNESFDRASLHQAQVVMFPDNAHIFDEVVAGHADVMITDGVETRLQQKLHPELCAIHPDRPFNTSELAYMMPQDAAWQQYVDQWLRISDETGEHARIVGKWLN
jgi:cyclohexadienyl dehydratase